MFGEPRIIDGFDEVSAFMKLPGRVRTGLMMVTLSARDVPGDERVSGIAGILQSVKWRVAGCGRVF